MEIRQRNTLELAELLREYDITATLQRVEIARVLFEEHHHHSAEQIMTKLNEKHGTMVSKATIYNTLHLFVKKGLIKELIIDSSRVFYEPKTTDHHHYYNIDTGELTDFDADILEKDALPPLPTGMSVVGVDVTVRVRQATS